MADTAVLLPTRRATGSKTVSFTIVSDAGSSQTVGGPSTTGYTGTSTTVIATGAVSNGNGPGVSAPAANDQITNASTIGSTNTAGVTLVSSGTLVNSGTITGDNGIAAQFGLARCLVNGASVVQERGLAKVGYIHVEMDDHDVLLAEGAPSERFMDADSRSGFHNAHECAARYPDAPSSAGFCAPPVEAGRALEAARRRLPQAGRALARLQPPRGTVAA